MIWVLLILLSFGLYLCGISFSNPSLSVCMCPLFWSGSLVDSIYRGLVFVSIQLVFVFWLGHSTHLHLRTSLVAQMVKCLFTMLETWVRSLGWEDSLEKEMAIHSSTIAWKIPWAEEAGRLQSTGSQRVGHDWETSLWWDRSVSASYIFISSVSVSPYWLRTSNIYLFPNLCIKLEFKKVGMMFYLCQLDLRENGWVKFSPSHIVPYSPD